MSSLNDLDFVLEIVEDHICGPYLQAVVALYSDDPSRPPPCPHQQRDYSCPCPKVDYNVPVPARANEASNTESTETHKGQGFE